MGVSEWLTSLGLWAADTGQGGRGHVFYVMPTENTMRDFTQARIDRAIADSPHLKSRVGTLSKVDRSPDRTALKRVGPGYIYFRGSDRRQLASVDADVVILDEFDQMDDQVLSLALQRLASSKLGWIRVASTPGLPEAGVNGLFRQSDQRRYLLPCPKCGKRQPLTWEENVDLERALLVCGSRRCRAQMDIWAEGEWVATASENSWRGYHLNRLYSHLANLEEMIVESQSSGPSAQTAFQNQVLGEVFVPSGSGLTLTDLDKCRREYSL